MCPAQTNSLRELIKTKWTSNQMNYNDNSKTLMAPVSLSSKNKCCFWNYKVHNLVDPIFCNTSFQAGWPNALFQLLLQYCSIHFSLLWLVFHFHVVLKVWDQDMLINNNYGSEAGSPVSAWGKEKEIISGNNKGSKKKKSGKCKICCKVKC